jgi:hydrogenase nickel incorporation protein HypB
MDEVRLIEVKQDIHADNERAARELRERLAKQKTFLLNLMSSPGAGKTSTIIRTIDALRGSLEVGVIEADIDSTVDAERVAAQGVSAIQLRTGGFCHLDAAMVARGLDGLDLDALDIVIIENVGNLVCPAEFDTGAIRNAMILSVPEGDDKPLKYPLMFTVSDVLLINKIDYLELSDFDIGAMRERVQRLNPEMQIFEVSAKTGEGIADWAGWLSGEAESFLGDGG